MARKKNVKTVYIDGDKAKEVIANSNMTQSQIGVVLGYSKAWMNQVCSAGRISEDDLNRIKAMGLDLTGCLITKSEHEAPTVLMKDLAEIKNNGEALQKIITEYSDARKEDAIMIEEAIDRLTTIMSELLFVLKG